VSFGKEEVAMAQEIFLELTGIKGESKVKGFEDKIDIESFSLGVSNVGTGHHGGGSGAGRADVADLAVQKRADKATPTLYKFCFQGKHMDKGTLTVRKAGGDQAVQYLKYEMDEVFISHIQTADAAGGGLASESLSLNFSKIKMTYTYQEKSGSAGAETPVTLDVKQNEAT
jgi:type VI secretion system secreted protein Hcp